MNKKKAVPARTAPIKNNSSVILQYPKAKRNPLHKTKESLIDCDAEMSASIAADKSRTDSFLKSIGITPEMVKSAPASVLGHDRVNFISGNFYEPDPSGYTAIIMATNILDDGSIENLIAFDPENSMKWGSRRGIVESLGHHNIERVQFGVGEKKLYIHGNCLTYLKHHCLGYLPWTPKATDVLIRYAGHFDNPNTEGLEFIADNEVHAFKLDARLTMPRCNPNIVY